MPLRLGMYTNCLPSISSLPQKLLYTSTRLHGNRDPWRCLDAAQRQGPPQSAKNTGVGSQQRIHTHSSGNHWVSTAGLAWPHAKPAHVLCFSMGLIYWIENSCTEISHGLRCSIWAHPHLLCHLHPWPWWIWQVYTDYKYTPFWAVVVLNLSFGFKYEITSTSLFHCVSSTIIISKHWQALKYKELKITLLKLHTEMEGTALGIELPLHLQPTALLTRQHSLLHWHEGTRSTPRNTSCIKRTLQCS